MKILHTSDWHLGRTLYGKKERNEEHSAFLEWLLKTIKVSSIDLLIIAGDIFDNSSPNSNSQKMYYDFLIKVIRTGCQNVIVIGGNHDSPSFLNAPKDILSALNVVVVGNASENIEDEIIILKDENNKPLVIVCAVPFLRERDISRFAEGENYSDKSKRINENIKKHYAEIAKLALEKQQALGENIPIIATGHLSVAGGKRNEDDGVRETYIGNIEAVGSDIFPEVFDYVALGHYHIPTNIKDHIRYCGSPIPMGFGEKGEQKCIFVINFDDGKSIEKIQIPTFQKLESIVGNKNYIANRLQDLKNLDISCWVEIVYKDDDIFPELSTWVSNLITDSKIEILKLQNNQHLNNVLSINDTNANLDEMNVYDVFDKLIDKAVISDLQKDELKDTYKEIVQDLFIQN